MSDDAIILWKAEFNVISENVELARGLATTAADACDHAITGLAANGFADVAPYRGRLQAVRTAIAEASSGNSLMVAAHDADAITLEVQDDDALARQIVGKLAALDVLLTAFRNDAPLVMAPIPEVTQVLAQRPGFDAPQAVGPLAVAVEAALEQARAAREIMDRTIAADQARITAKIRNTVMLVESIRDNPPAPYVGVHAAALITRLEDRLRDADAAGDDHAKAVIICAPQSLAEQAEAMALMVEGQEIAAKFTGLQAHADKMVDDIVRGATRMPLLQPIHAFTTQANTVAATVAPALALTTFAEIKAGVNGVHDAFDAVMAHLKTFRDRINDGQRKLRTLENILGPYRAIPGAKEDIDAVDLQRGQTLALHQTEIATANYAAVDGVLTSWLGSLDSLIGTANTIRGTFLDLGKNKQAIQTLLDAARQSIEAMDEAAEGRGALVTEHGQLVARLDGLDGLGNKETTGKAAVVLRKDAKALLAKLSAADLKATAALDDGAARIKAIIDGFDATNANPAQDVIAQQAIQVLFGIEFKVEDNVETKWTPKLFKLLYDVPRHHVKGNKALKRIEYATEPESEHNYYRSSDKLIALNATPEDGTTVPYEPDNPTGMIARLSLAADEITKKQDLEYYSSTALHEVGHAVDDAKEYMKKKAGNATYGGWVTGVTLTTVADAIGTHKGFYKKYNKGTVTLDDLRTLLVMCLDGRRPAAAFGSLAANWGAIGKDAVLALCESAQCKRTPWDFGKAQAASLKVDKMVYHESYDGDWVGYQHAARDTTGISNYQWRAPGEWFAEIYAIHAMGKLSKRHPMYAELEAMKNP